MSKNTSVLADRSTSELETEVKTLREQLFRLRWQASTGKVENPNRIREVRRAVARHLTELRRRVLASASGSTR